MRRFQFLHLRVVPAICIVGSLLKLERAFGGLNKFLGRGLLYPELLLHPDLVYHRLEVLGGLEDLGFLVGILILPERDIGLLETSPIVGSLRLSPHLVRTLQEQLHLLVGLGLLSRPLFLLEIVTFLRLRSYSFIQGVLESKLDVVNL